MERLILADESLAEIGFLDFDIDLELGDSNDFVIYIPYPEWDGKLQPGMYVYIPGTEYGGVIRAISGNTKEDQIQITGTTWRGMLAQRFICPPAGSDYFTVSGELNTCIRTVVGSSFGDLFTVKTDRVIRILSDYRFERYCSVLDGLTKMLQENGYKLVITYKQTQEGGYVLLYAETVRDLSDKVQISQDYQLDFISRKDYGFVNHLICLGSGQLKDRTVVHLYANEDREISQTQTFTGEKEIQAVYDYPNAEDAATLVRDGTKKLTELISTDEMEVSIGEGADIDVDIGDVVGGHDYITGIDVKVTVTKKVLKVTGGVSSVEYGLEEIK